MENNVIGRVLATEKRPTTIDDFTFWTDPQLILNPFDIVKVQHVKLKIEGILLTMVDNRTNYARDISLMVYDTYSASIKVFGTEIPMSVRASEVSVEGEASIPMIQRVKRHLLIWHYAGKHYQDQEHQAVYAGSTV